MTDLYAFPKPGDPGKSILVLNVHPSVGVNPPGPTTKEPFAPEALYEFKIDTDDDAVADIAYSVQFSSSEDGKQTATLRRIQGERAARPPARLAAAPRGLVLWPKRNGGWRDGLQGMGCKGSESAFSARHRRSRTARTRRRRSRRRALWCL